MAKRVSARWVLPVILLLIVNLVAFAVMGADKHRAVAGEWRISEAALFAPAVLGGAPGALLGMQIFRHKTNTPIFRYGMPTLCVLESILFLALAIRKVLRR